MSHGAAPYVTEVGSTGTAPTNKWDPFFGTPEGFHEDVRADDQLSHETFNLPKAYEGKNKRLEDILDFMIRKEDEFYTRELLPWEYTDDLHIVWDVWKFNRTLADVVPEQGISRLVTQESERHTDNLVRRGLAFQLEHGFMTTDKGRRNYALNLQQISDAVHTTCYFGVMHALFAGQNYYKEYRRKFARFVKGPRTLFRHERQMWACLQKDIKGVYIMDAEIKHHMKINGIVPNVLVLPPKAGIYVSMVPPRETEFHLRGPGAHEALTKDRTGISSFRGSKVFEAQSFDVDFQHEFIDLTSRPRMCGEYFVIPGSQEPHNLMSTINDALRAMLDKPINPQLGEPKLEDVLGEELRRDPFIHIYSADKDDYVKITYSEANTMALNGVDPYGRAQRLADLKKKLDGLHSTFSEMSKKAIAAKKTPREKKEEAARWAALVRSAFDTSFSRTPPLSDLIGLVQDIEDELKKDSFDSREVGGKIKEADLLIHHRHFTQKASGDKHRYDILLLRPFQTYTMHSAILAKGGSDLGNTYHGHHDFQLSDNVAVKTHFGNYTFYSKCVVKRPRNYTIIPDCFAQGYVSGEGHAFFKPPKGASGGVRGIPLTYSNDPGDLGKAIQEGSLGSSDCRQSLIAWRIPRGDGEKLEDAIDITGRFAGAHRDYEPSDELHFEGADALGSLEYIEELDQNRGDDAYLHQVQQVNTVCFRGAQYTNGTFTHQGKGHWGTPYAGVLPVRDGAVMYMDPSKEPKKGDQVV
jgi:hypothetical protein